jgi:hypothetical protein
MTSSLRNTSIALSFLLAFACSKNSDTPDNGIISADKLMGKWAIAGAEIKETKNGSTETNTIIFDAGSYIEFKSPNLLTANVNGQSSQTTWALNNGKMLTIVPNGSLSLPEEIYIYQITTLNATDLVLTGQDTDNNNTGETHVVIIQLHR